MEVLRKNGFSPTEIYPSMKDHSNICQTPVKHQSLIAKKTVAHQAVPKPNYEWRISWRNVIVYAYLHVGLVYGFILMFTRAKLATTIFSIALSQISGLSITAGAHRLWSHRSYKARWPLRVFLAILQTIAFQNHIFEWVRDHRVHHKFTETDADPHNAKRGFFFSHIGWLLIKKHKDVKEKGKTVDMSDLEKDFVVVFQRKYYLILLPLLSFIIPAWIPVYYWGEDGWVSWYVAVVFRYTLSVNETWLVNSVAHIWGSKPFDKSIAAVNNIPVAYLALGEGWHNYHHVFPWDYKAAELGTYKRNYTLAFIEFCAWLGLAYDLKTVSEDMVRRRALRTGDGSWLGAAHAHDHGQDSEPEQVDGTTIWGWGDKDMDEQDVNEATRILRDTSEPLRE